MAGGDLGKVHENVNLEKSAVPNWKIAFEQYIRENLTSEF